MSADPPDSELERILIVDGDPGEPSIDDVERIRSAFEAHRIEIEAIAEKFGLVLNGVPRSKSGWDLGLRHPKGGAGFIHLEFNPEKGSFNIRGNWVLDDYDNGTRFLKMEELARCGSHESLSSKVPEALRALLSWDRGELQAFPGVVPRRGLHTWEECFQRGYPNLIEPRNLQSLAS